MTRRRPDATRGRVAATRTGTFALTLAFGVAIALAATLTVTLAFGVAIALAATLTVTLAVGVAIALAATLTVTLAFGVAIALAAAFTVTLAVGVAIALAAAFTVALAVGVAIALAAAFTVALAVGVAIALAAALTVALAVGVAIALAAAFTVTGLALAALPLVLIARLRSFGLVAARLRGRRQRGRAAEAEAGSIRSTGSASRGSWQCSVVFEPGGRWPRIGLPCARSSRPSLTRSSAAAHRDPTPSVRYRGAQRSPLTLTPTSLVQDWPEGRYRLGDELGRGGFGVVYRAWDELVGEPVAVKLLDAARLDHPERVARELQSLRVLGVDGVVRLRDEGVAGHRPFLVMDLVGGAPFPGRGRAGSWERIAPVARRLLEIVGEVHARGIVHRDLKPANVLVDDDGEPTVLDFGIAHGPALGARVTTDGKAPGTPRYMAPELLRGERAGVRSDLYALGVMIREALARFPESADVDIAEGDDTALRATLPPDPPAAVVRWLDTLDAFDPGARPRSAQAALERLDGPSQTAVRLPWLGATALVDALEERVREGRSATFLGERGAGRSRTLAELAARLAHAGTEARWVEPGTRPFLGLAPLIGERALDELLAADDADGVDARVAVLLETGVAVLVDDAERVDAATKNVLARVSAHGAVVTARVGVAGESELVVPPLGEADLRPLFRGLDRLFHEREDAARLLAERTDGNAARVADEVEGWVRRGLARWEGGRIALVGDALQRLRAGLRVPVYTPVSGAAAGVDDESRDLLVAVGLAWPEARPEVLAAVLARPVLEVRARLEELGDAGLVRVSADGRVGAFASGDWASTWSAERLHGAHVAIARELEPGAGGRLHHWLAAGVWAEAADEALALARRLGADDDVASAGAALAEGLLAARRAGDGEREGGLLVELLHLALRAGTAHALAELDHELTRSVGDGEVHEAVRGLMEFRLASFGRPAEAVERLDELPVPADPRLALARHAVRIRVARMQPGVELEERAVGEAERWAAATADPALRAYTLGWRGWLAYNRGRFAEAAELQARAAELAPERWLRVLAMVDGASARLEAHEHARAEEEARAALVELAEFRHPTLEARAEIVVRAALYRRGVAEAPDLELVEAVAELGAAHDEARAALNEAAVAWRLGEQAVARRLAARATRAWRGRPRLAVLPAALFLTMAERVRAERVEELARVAAAERKVPEYGAQALGLLARRFPERAR